MMLVGFGGLGAAKLASLRHRRGFRPSTQALQYQVGDLIDYSVHARQVHVRLHGTRHFGDEVVQVHGFNFYAAVTEPASASGAPEPATVFSMPGGMALRAGIARSSRARSRNLNKGTWGKRRFRHFRRFLKPALG
jgi:hypothetical protein